MCWLYDALAVIIGVLGEVVKEVEVLLVTSHGNPLVDPVISGEIGRKEDGWVEAVHLIREVVVMLAVRPSHEDPWRIN